MSTFGFDKCWVIFDEQKTTNINAESDVHKE